MGLGRLRKFFARHSTRSNTRRVDERTPTMETQAVAESASTLPKSIAPIDAQRTAPPVPKIRFRVLIIGRANAGKTTILQRVCDTTESPKIYRGNEEVRGPSPSFWSRRWSMPLISLPARLRLARPWKLVIIVFLFWLPLTTEPARRARDRRRACFLQSRRLYLPRFARN
jgi:hypothetical protein